MKTNQARAVTPDFNANSVPDPLRIAPLDIGHIDAMIALQRHGGERIIPRDADELSAHFANCNPGFGAFNGPHLVGQALLTFEPRASVGSSSRTMAKVGTVVIAPEARQHSAAARLLTACELDAAAHGCDALYLRVQIDNLPALALFQRHGFVKTATGNSPDRSSDDASLVHTMVKPIRAPVPQLGAVPDWRRLDRL